MIHHNFTENEFREYLKCIRNLKVGDEVSFYVPDDHYDIGPFGVIGERSRNKSSLIVLDMEGPDKTGFIATEYGVGFGGQIPNITLAGVNNAWAWHIPSWNEEWGVFLSKISRGTKYDSFRYVGSSTLISSIRKAK